MSSYLTYKRLPIAVPFAHFKVEAKIHLKLLQRFPAVRLISLALLINNIFSPSPKYK